MKSYKALALLSGGLDSLLAAKMIQNQGIHVEGINFYTGFCVEGHTHAIRKKDQKKNKRNNALWAAETLGIPLHIEDVVEEYKKVVYQPKYGYGKNLNPCTDCKVFMVNRACQWIKDNGFDFIITGEVIGQRPKSQRRETMNIVNNQSGANDLLLRPLSAKYFPPTLPERNGWVDREHLGDLHGRSRNKQMALAKAWGINDYAQPAGGCCFLTDKYYAAKLVDMWQANGSRQYEMDDIMLLKVGRHIRPKSSFKLIIGREEGENHYLSGYRKQYIHIMPKNCIGPFSLVDGTLSSPADLELAAKIIGRFCKSEHNEPFEFEIIFPSGENKQIAVTPFNRDDIQPNWYVERQQIKNLDSIPTPLQLEY